MARAAEAFHGKGDKVRVLKDIRYYESAEVPGPQMPMSLIHAGLLGIPVKAHRVGQRIACLLHAEGFTVGDYDHVYIAFTPALSEGQVVPTGFGHERWHRYTACGVAPGFRELRDDRKLAVIERATFEVLRALRPDEASQLERVRERMARCGPRTRILRASKETRTHRFEVWFDVPDWPETCCMYIIGRNNASGDVLEAPPIQLRDWEDAFYIASGLTFSGGVLRLKPRTSFRANLTTRLYHTPLEFPLSGFAPSTPCR